MNKVTSLTSRIRISLEETKKLDIVTLARSGVFRPGKSGTLAWHVGGQSVGTIGFHFDDQKLELSYRYKNFDGQWQPVKQTIEIVSLVTVHGFHQEQFLCPSCHSKVSTLAGFGKYFLCRHCCQTPYSGRNESAAARTQLPKHFISAPSNGFLDSVKADRYKSTDLGSKHCELVIRETPTSDNSVLVS